MKPIKPSCHPGLACVFTDYVPPWIQRLPTAELLRILSLPGTGNALPRAVRWELGIRHQMAEELLDLQKTAPSTSGESGGDPNTDLSILQLASPPRDGGDTDECYGDCPPRSEQNFWYVVCRKHRWPWRGALPLGFETRKQAETAMHALKAAGLRTEAALHQRIKIDLDWEGVKRIMLDAHANT